MKLRDRAFDQLCTAGMRVLAGRVAQFCISTPFSGTWRSETMIASDAWIDGRSQAAAALRAAARAAAGRPAQIAEFGRGVQRGTQLSQRPKMERAMISRMISELPA